MTLEKTPQSAGPPNGKWTESWKLSFEVDGLMKETLTGLMNEDGKRRVGQYGLFLYSDHSALIHWNYSETEEESVIDKKDVDTAMQLEAFSDYLVGLKDIGFGRLFALRRERAGIVVRTAAHLGQIATSSLRRDENMAAGRSFLSGPSSLLKLTIPERAVDRGVDIRLAEAQRRMNLAFYGNASGGLPNATERVRRPDSAIVPSKLLKNRLRDAA